MNYSEFLESKSHIRTRDGFTPVLVPENLFDFQQELVEWAVSQGRAALFVDTGLGKTAMQLTWAENVVKRTNKPVLVLTPLAVSHQTVREAAKFGIEAARSVAGEMSAKIVVANYERLHYFDPADFAGVVCDESSILKNFNGARRSEITGFMRKVRYRLLCTATAAPNDYTELGTSSEALGYLGHMDMLNRFFKNDKSNSSMGRHYGKATQWRFKGHAEEPFWRWVCSWARAVRKPSDLGFDDSRFDLPPLIEQEHVVTSNEVPEGMLFALPVNGLKEERDERRRTIGDRCERVSELVRHDEPALVWCHLNDEGDLLQELIPDAVQVSGSDSDEAKEEKLIGFANGDVRVLITKPKIGAWGLNFQHCAHVTIFPSHSFEQYYQSIRRCWRFGQTRPVLVDIVSSEGEKGVLRNLQAKAVAADRMFSRLVSLMKDQLDINQYTTYPTEEELPTWLF